MQCLGDRSQQALLAQIRNDGIVDLKQDAILLFTFAQRLFRTFPLRDVDKRDHGAKGLTTANDNVRPKLYRKARAVFSPINLIVPVDVRVVLETNIDRTFFNWIGRAVFSGM